MMVFMSLLPAGIYQAYHSITTGLWYARSPEAKLLGGPRRPALEPQLSGVGIVLQRAAASS
jgi:hypothetical protein